MMMIILNIILIKKNIIMTIHQAPRMTQKEM